jgi:hypothetical protein
MNFKKQRTKINIKHVLNLHAVISQKNILKTANMKIPYFLNISNTLPKK